MSKPMSEQMQKLAARYEKATGKKFCGKTNAQKIRAMNDEELARFLASVENRRSAAGGGAQWCGMAHALKWLQQPAEENDHDERKENEHV